MPVWIVLLGLLPLTGMGPLPCLSLATLLAAGAVVAVERRRARRAADGGEALGRGRRGPMSAPAAVALTLGAVALVAYAILVIRAA